MTNKFPSGLVWCVEAAKVILFQNIKGLVGPLMVYASTKDFSCRQSSRGAGWSGVVQEVRLDLKMITPQVPTTKSFEIKQLTNSLTSAKQQKKSLQK